MLESIKKAVLRLFPELSAGLHLDRYARVLAVNDAPSSGGTCDRFRPRYAVDLEILDPDGKKDEAFPTYEAVPLPVAAGCGMEAGFFAFPAPGCLVVIGFAYGRPDCPIVRQVYPIGLSLPDITAGTMRWQQSATVFQEADFDGNWRRVTDQAITDESVTRITRAVEALAEIAREVRTIDENSTEQVGGIKLLKAFGALKLLSGGSANLSAIDNINLTTARDLHLIAAGDRDEVSGNNQISNVNGNRTATIGGDDDVSISGNRTETITGTKQTIAAVYQVVAPAISIGSPNSGPSLLPLISDLMSQISDVLTILATHTHPSVGSCSQSSTITSVADAIDDIQTDLDSLSG